MQNILFHYSSLLYYTMHNNAPIQQCHAFNLNPTFHNHGEVGKYHNIFASICFFFSVTGQKKSMEMLFLNDFYPPISIEAIVGLQNYEKSCLLNSFRSNSNKVTTVTTA